MSHTSTSFEQIPSSYLKPKQAKNRLLAFIFILIAAAISFLFWNYKNNQFKNEVPPTPVVETETPNPQEDILLDLKASVGDLEIPSFHESF